MASSDSLLKIDADAQDLLFREARTANAFTDEPVPDETLRAVYDLVQWAPTSANGQPLRVLAVRSDDARARLLPHMSEGNRAKTAAAPLVLVMASDSRFHEHMDRIFPHAPGARSWFEGSPEADTAREAGAAMNAAMQTAYWTVGLRAAGLACGPMSGFDTAGVDAEFFPDGRFRSFLVMNVGKPAAEGAWFGRSPRHAYEDVVQTV
ncbi:MAG TPA: malonic semialdehyde reductase [Rubricoccaceae bacterium]|jgi:3-hydroxypropanoate dehydrogenase